MISLVWASVLGLSGGYYSSDDLDSLAEAVYFEARSEVTACQIVLAQTILNRASQTRFPDSVRSVIHQRKRNTKGTWVCQYSYYCDGKADIMKDYISEVKSYQVASLVLGNEVLDLSEGADHYYAHYSVTPGWANKMTDVFICGAHTFGKLEWN